MWFAKRMSYDFTKTIKIVNSVHCSYPTLTIPNPVSAYTETSPSTYTTNPKNNPHKPYTNKHIFKHNHDVQTLLSRIKWLFFTSIVKQQTSVLLSYTVLGFRTLWKFFWRGYGRENKRVDVCQRVVGTWCVFCSQRVWKREWSICYNMSTLKT